MMGNVCKETNEIVFVMDYLMEMYNFTIVSFHFLLIKKNILYMYKITVVPFTTHRVRLWHLLGLKINVTNFPKIHDFLQDLGIIMHEV